MKLFLKSTHLALLYGVLLISSLWSAQLFAQEIAANQPPVNHQPAGGNAEQNTTPNSVQPNSAQPPDGANPNGANGRNTGRARFNARQQRLEDELRRAMTSLGCSDATIQDAVLTYIREETRARRPLVEQSRRLFFMLRSSSPETASAEPAPAESPQASGYNVPKVPGQNATSGPNTNTGRKVVPSKSQSASPVVQPAVGDLQVLAAQVSTYRAALEADRVRHKAAEAALDSKIKYSQNPRLEAMLLLMGVIGDSPNLPLRAGALAGGPPARDGVPRPPGLRNNAPGAAIPPGEMIPPAEDGANQEGTNQEGVTQEIPEDGTINRNTN